MRAELTSCSLSRYQMSQQSFARWLIVSPGFFARLPTTLAGRTGKQRIYSRGEEICAVPCADLHCLRFNTCWVDRDLVSFSNAIPAYCCTGASFLSGYTRLRAAGSVNWRSFILLGSAGKSVWDCGKGKVPSYGQHKRPRWNYKAGVFWYFSQ